MYKINLIMMLGSYEGAHCVLEEKIITAVEEMLMRSNNVGINYYHY